MASYECDFYQWTQEQAVLLRSGTLGELDAFNVAEEIESVGNSHRHAVESYVHNIIMHLLKWQYQPSRRGESWRLSIDIGRHQITKRLDESPSLRAKKAVFLRRVEQADVSSPPLERETVYAEWLARIGYGSDV